LSKLYLNTLIIIVWHAFSRGHARPRAALAWAAAVSAWAFVSACAAVISCAFVISCRDILRVIESSLRPASQWPIVPACQVLGQLGQLRQPGSRVRSASLSAILREYSASLGAVILARLSEGFIRSAWAAVISCADDRTLTIYLVSGRQAWRLPNWACLRKVGLDRHVIAEGRVSVSTCGCLALAAGHLEVDTIWVAWVAWVALTDCINGVVGRGAVGQSVSVLAAWAVWATCQLGSTEDRPFRSIQAGLILPACQPVKTCGCLRIVTCQRRYISRVQSIGDNRIRSASISYKGDRRRAGHLYARSLNDDLALFRLKLLARLPAAAGLARRSQIFPGAPRRSQVISDHTGLARRSQALPGAPRSCQLPPAAAGLASSQALPGPAGLASSQALPGPAGLARLSPLIRPSTTKRDVAKSIVGKTWGGHKRASLADLVISCAAAGLVDLVIYSVYTSIIKLEVTQC